MKRAKTFKSKPSRSAARIALLAMLAVSQERGRRRMIRHPDLRYGRFVHGGPDRLKHPKWDGGK